jgi:hypothetical protein
VRHLRCLLVTWSVPVQSFLAVPNVSAPAKDRLHYPGALRAECAKEINSECSGVSEARGQLLACLYQHQAILSPTCEGTVWGSIEALGKALAKEETVRRYCDADAIQWCKETISGGGRLLSCFLWAQQMMSPLCKAAVYSIWDKRRQRGELNTPRAAR